MYPMSATMMAFVERVMAGEAPAVAAEALGYPPGEVERLLTDQRVRVALAKGAYPAVPTRDDLVGQLDADHAMAVAGGEASAAVAATMAKAKVLGLVVDRAEVTGRGGAPLNLTRIELVIVNGPAEGAKVIEGVTVRPQLEGPADA